MAKRKAREQRQSALVETETVEVGGWSRAEFGAVVALGLVFCAAVAVELGGVTPEGTLQLTHWTPWRNLGILKTAAILALPLPLILWALWRAQDRRTSVGASVGLTLGLLFLANIALQALGLMADPRGLDMVG